MELANGAGCEETEGWRLAGSGQQKTSFAADKDSVVEVKTP
jgi:hypothetical protein